MFKEKDILADLHTHSIMSLHAYNTVQEIIDKTTIPYVAVTDHLQDFNNFYLTSNITAYIEDLWEKYKHEPRLIAGVELDFNISAGKTRFRRGLTNFGILSFHDNGPLDVDYFIKQIDELNPHTIGHPFRYLESRPEDIEKFKEVVEYAVSKGIMIELNENSLRALPVDFLRSLNCTFTLGTDSHEYHSIGKFSKCVDFLNTYFPTAHVVNFDKSWLEMLQKSPRAEIAGTTWGEDLKDYVTKYKCI